MKIYTKKGDAGETSLLGGTRVPKYDPRIEAYGTVDELNAQLGVLGDQDVLASFRPLLQQIQHTLFSVGSILANDQEKSHFQLPPVKPDTTRALETSIDEMNAELPELKNFVLPGGHPANSLAHVARCVCRRAERRVVELHHAQDLDPQILPFLNRLSDWLFVLSRYASHRAGAPEVIWKSES